MLAEGYTVPVLLGEQVVPLTCSMARVVMRLAPPATCQGVPSGLQEIHDPLTTKWSKGHSRSCSSPATLSFLSFGPVSKFLELQPCQSDSRTLSSNTLPASHKANQRSRLLFRTPSLQLMILGGSLVSWAGRSSPDPTNPQGSPLGCPRSLYPTGYWKGLPEQFGHL